MKKIILIISLFLIGIFNVYASVNIEKGSLINVKFDKCIDGDTASFIYKNERIKVRFLAINTPEIGNNEEEYGRKASNYTCDKLKQAKVIKLEFDKKSNIKDKYDRYLAWVFVDDTLLQKELIKESLAKTAYLYDEYKYTKELQELEEEIKKQNKNIWSNTNNSKNYDYLYVVPILLILLLIVLLKK